MSSSPSSSAAGRGRTAPSRQAPAGPRALAGPTLDGETRATTRSVFWPVLAITFLHGALLYGVAISWLHVRHNRVDSVVASLSTLVFFALFFGVWSAAWGVVAALVHATRGGRRGPSAASSSGAVWTTVGWGVALFAVPFWLLVLLYGLTYDQTIFWHPQGPLGMTAYLVLAALLVVAVVCLVKVLLASAMRALARRRLLGMAATVLVLVALALHVGLPLEHRRSQAPAVPSLSASDVEVAQTGVDVIVIGLDGLDPRVVARLVGAGDLPHFERLSRSGASGALGTLAGANSAVIWASIYTGQRPGQHGILDFYRVQLPGTGEGVFPVHRTFFKELADRLPKALARRSTVTRSSLRRFPVWEIADHFGLSIGVVDGYLYSFPALVPDTAGSFFASYGLDGLADLLDRGAARGVDLPLYLQPVDLLGGELPRGADFDWQSQTLLELLAERPQPRLVSLYAHQPDAIQHQSWRVFEPERYWLARGEEGGGAIPEMHRRFDRFLGELSGLASERTAVLVISDHGHSPTLVHAMDTQHRHGPPGAALFFGGPFRSGVTLENAHVYDVYPTVLHLLGLPVPDDAEGRVLTELLEPAFLQQFPLRTIPSYEGLWRPPLHSFERDRVLDEIELEKLRAMGYL